MSELRTHSLRHNTWGGDNPNIEMFADGSTSINRLQNTSNSLIVNGAMNLAQRGTTSTANGRQTVDGFQIQFDSGAVTQSQQDADETDDALIWNEGFRKYYRMANTTAITTNDSSFRLFRYWVEAQDMATSGWNYTSDTGARHNVCLSFWIRSSVGQEFSAYLTTNDGTAQGYSFNFTLTADTWTPIHHVIPGAANVQFDMDVERGLGINICAWLGTDLTDSTHTDETWANFANNNRVGDMTDTWADTANATFDLTGVQLTVTDSPIAFQHEDAATNLAKCQRYFTYIRSGIPAASTFTLFAIGRANSGTNARFLVPLPTTMRATPALTRSGAFTCAGGTVTSMSTTHSSPWLSQLSVNRGSGMTIDDAVELRANDDSDARLNFSAEL